MFNLQGSEIIVILLLALVVLGPEKLPDAIRRFTQTYNELKKLGSGFQSELKSALDEPIREMRETAEIVRDAADPDKVASATERSSPKPGDPPLVHPEEPEPAPAVNRIAAANSSAAIAAARDAEDGASADPAPESVEGAPAESTAAEAAPGPGGPSFHSAAPRRPAPPDVDGADDAADPTPPPVAGAGDAAIPAPPDVDGADDAADPAPPSVAGAGEAGDPAPPHVDGAEADHDRPVESSDETARA